MMRKIKTISKRMIGFLYVILIMLSLNGHGRIDAQPISGDWSAPTDFGQFSFTVNGDGSLITQFIIDVSNWQCANVSGSWITTITWTLPNTGCPISNNTFSYQSSSPQEIWDVAGTFNQSGNQASGTWSYTIAGGTCNGIWGPIVKTTQTVIPQGDVSGTWTLAGSPYLIDGEITVPDGETLTIEPGVLVEFQGHYKLNVQGRLLAVGTENDSIVFTINDTTGFSNPDIPDGGWHSIRFSLTPSTNDSSKIVYCKLQNSKAIGSWPDNHGAAIWVLYFDKLIISNCLISNNIACGGDWPSGGGIALHGSSPVIKGNMISNNSAMNGGGIVCYDASNPQIINNLIINNSATSGGGIVCNENSNPTITNTTIENNNATDGGGGIICWYTSSPSLNNVTISKNSAIWAGGIGVVNCNLQIDSCTFIDNEALVASGGAINCQYETNNTYQLNIKNTVFTSNSAASSTGGLHARAHDSARVNIIVDECTFDNNDANTAGGIAFVGPGTINFTITNSMFINNEVLNHTGAGFFTSRGNGMASNCLFAFNTAGAHSGCISVWSNADVNFMNCTFVNNSAIYGAGLTVSRGGIASATNCIFWGNSTDQIAIDTLNGEGGILTVNYCDIQGGADSVNVNDTLSTLIWGKNNMAADPLFVNPAIGDYHLQELSPCNGAGIDAIEIDGVWLTAADTDIEGNTCPNPAGTMPDIGAYEAPFDPVGIEDEITGLPEKYSLSQNYPNPFNPATTIKYSIPSSNSPLLGGAGGGLRTVTLKVYNILGRELATLVNKEQRPGYYEVKWDATSNPSGIYFYKLEAGIYSETKKMLLIK